MSGFIVRGKQVAVPGVWMLNAFDDVKLRLDERDCRTRQSGWVRMLVLHTTKGLKVQRTISGKGPSLRGKRVAEYWDRDPEHSGAHIVIGSDGVGVCLADVVTEMAHHASNKLVNDRSIGIEIYQEADGGVYQAAINAAVATCRALVSLDDPAIAIQWQHQRVYHKRPIARLVAGGADVVGIVGHRDVTENRGWGDPGDAIFAALANAGSEPVDFDAREDLELWRDRQLALKEQGHLRGAVDGIAGPATRAALRAAGYSYGVRAFGRAEAE
jgi:hypothetical protein